MNKEKITKLQNIAGITLLILCTISILQNKNWVNVMSNLLWIVLALYIIITNTKTK